MQYTPDQADQSRQAVPLPPDARRVLLLVNRKAGNGRGKKSICKKAQALTEAGFPTTVVGDLAEFEDLAQSTWEAGDLRAVSSAGGDGTVSVALNLAPAGVPIVIYPMGTENLLARYLGHRRNVHAIVELMQQGVVIPLDAAQAGDRLFSMVFSAGLDAEVVHQVHQRRNGNITHLAYAAPLIKAVANYKYPQVRVTSTDPSDAFSIEACWVFAFNLPNYALGLPLAPQAVGYDGKLDLCLFERGSLGNGLRYFAQLVRGRHHKLDDVHTHQGASYRIEAVNGDRIPYQIDGDPGGELPVDLTVLPGRMRMLVSAEVARRLGFSVA